MAGRAYSGQCWRSSSSLPNRKSVQPGCSVLHWSACTGYEALYKEAPDFAAEVRSEGDYGPTAEKEIAAKRSDYFAAGTKVVWDVDLLSENVVRVYRADSPTEPTTYRKGDLAEAEPAVPGWTMAVESLFD